MLENRNKNAFTLVELLAVLVILAVILVIAIPKVISIIKDVRISTLESTAKLVASTAEKKKVENEIMGSDEILTCENIVKLNDVDYESCYIEFTDDKALVTIIGSGVFKGMNVCDGTKNKVSVTERCLNKKVNIILNLNEGISNDISGIYKEGTVIKLEIPIKENNTFTHYEVVSGDSVIKDNILTVGSKDTIIHAMYDTWPSLTVDLNGGTSSTNQSGIYKSGSSIELETPIKTGYTFTGWDYSSGILSGNIFTLGNEEALLTATWKNSTFKVTFNPGDGTVSTTFKNVTYSNTYGELPIPVREEYMFIGWYTKNDIEVISTDKVEILNDIELTAKYVKNEFAYTGNYETFIVPKDGNYKIELWGAQGGNSITCDGGKGAYTSGIIELSKGEKIYFNVGGQGIQSGTADEIYSGGYNGGAGAYYEAGTGGGATDVRIDGKELVNRIIVAAGGGGSGMMSDIVCGGSAGGLIGYAGGSYFNETTTGEFGGRGATQISGGLAGDYWTGEQRDNTYLGTNGSFGIGGVGGYESQEKYKNGSGAGGAGYYGGGGGSERNGGGGGGSSFISGHDGCNAINQNSNNSNITHTGQSVHFSGYKFTNTVMIDGDGYKWTTEKGEYIGMPSYNGTETITGNIGNGYAKIIYVGEE